jgi:hypothetical protein
MVCSRFSASPLCARGFWGMGPSATDRRRLPVMVAGLMKGPNSSSTVWTLAHIARELPPLGASATKIAVDGGRLGSRIRTSQMALRDPRKAEDEAVAT